MKPSDFTKNFPFSSVYMNTETEIVAMNVMTILKRTGDVFRELSWDEYKDERMKDGNFSVSEKRYFERVIPYCVSGEEAKKFSKQWDI